MCRSLASVLVLIATMFTTACGDSDSPTSPGTNSAAPPTHYQITVQMSSIWAQNDCESTPGNPGDFRWRLIVRKRDELGNLVMVDDSGVQSASVSDGDRAGITADAVTFVMPNEPGAQFEVEHWIGEYDPGTDFEEHSWGIHVLDRHEDQMWAAGARRFESDRYYENEDGSGSGLYKYAVWNTRAECSGAAYYHVAWEPYEPANSPPGVSGPINATFSELDADATINLLANAFDSDGDPLRVVNIGVASGDPVGVSFTPSSNSLRVQPGAYEDLNGGESEIVVFNYEIVDDRGGSVEQSATIRINGAPSRAGAHGGGAVD